LQAFGGSALVEIVVNKVDNVIDPTYMNGHDGLHFQAGCPGFDAVEHLAPSHRFLDSAGNGGIAG
jgi:hypothetical protein